MCFNIVCSFVHPSARLSVRLCVRLCVHLSVHPSVRPFVRPSVRSFFHSVGGSVGRSPLCVCVHCFSIYFSPKIVRGESLCASGFAKCRINKLTFLPSKLLLLLLFFFMLLGGEV